jgi:DNA-binding response OmpR family regulator
LLSAQAEEASGRSRRVRMEDSTWQQRGAGGPHWIDAEMEALGRPSILLVEDDPDLRDLLSTLLRIAGFNTQPCASAEEGLEQLREQAFDMVLTDYMLPRRTGGWLLQQASEEGLLDAIPVLVVTTHPNPKDAAGYEVIQKPFDLDELVERVRQRLEGTSRPSSPRPLRRGPDRPGRDDDTRDGEIELILYVSAESPRSAMAISNIKKALARFESPKVRLTIHDLSKDPSKGVRDNIAFTPTLVKRSPGPRTFILGHMSNPDLLLELLEACYQS